MSATAADTRRAGGRVSDAAVAADRPACCGLYHRAIELVGKRWTGAILLVLMDGPLHFSDIRGQLKSFSINTDELDDAFEGGMGFDGSSITGFNAIEESDMIAQPDLSTFAVLPWRPETQGVARMFCDILTPSREPYEGDPRYVLRRALERASEMGFDAFNVGP